MVSSRLQHLTSLVFALNRRMAEYVAKNAKLKPYTIAAFRTLRYIAERDNLTMKDIARYLNVTPPSATAFIDGLVKAGHLARTPDKTDRRIIRLSITKKGQAYLTDGFKKVMPHMARMFSCFTAKEQNKFISILEKLSSKSFQQ